MAECCANDCALLGYLKYYWRDNSGVPPLISAYKPKIFVIISAYKPKSFFERSDTDLMDFVARRFIVQIHSAFKPNFVIIVIVIY